MTFCAACNIKLSLRNNDIDILSMKETCDVLIFSHTRCNGDAGGTSGLGVVNATYMLSMDAVALILIGRSGRCNRDADMQLLASKQWKSMVTLVRADMSSCAEVEDAMYATNNLSWRLEGVFQSAGLQVKLY
jgi:hypothetical protein